MAVVAIGRTEQYRKGGMTHCDRLPTVCFLPCAKQKHRQSRLLACTHQFWGMMGIQSTIRQKKFRSHYEEEEIIRVNPRLERGASRIFRENRKRLSLSENHTTRPIDRNLKCHFLNFINEGYYKIPSELGSWHAWMMSSLITNIRNSLPLTDKLDT